MANATPTIEFQFVNSTITSPTVPQDAEVRALIRKQAMKKASLARKRDGNYGKHNLRQYPVFIYDQSNTGTEVAEVWDNGKELGIRARRKDGGKNSKSNKDTRANPFKADKKYAERQQWLRKVIKGETIPQCLSPDGYELRSMQTDFDILDLSTLATLHIGRAVRGALSQNPYMLINQLRTHKRWSYLSFLPTRYEHIKCLRDATDCVIARARQIVTPNQNWEAAVIAFYLRALDSLQKALDSPTERYQPEVLCATEILALYEMLDPNGEMAWVRHSAGAAKLIHLRGPKNYDTEFEKALFMAQTVPIMTECLLKGERCFLEQKPWQEVMRSVIEEDAIISDRSEAVVTLLMNKCQIPGCGVDVTGLICTDTPPEPEEVERITLKIRQLRKNFLNWYKKYETILAKCPDMYPGSANHDSHCKVFANYLSCLMITSRFLVAISPSDRLEVEEYTQWLANEMVELENQVKLSPTSLFMAQTMAVAQSVMATKEDWLGDGEKVMSDEKGLIERWKLERWCGMFGRRMP
ncbi:uncharacterized protein LY89DRAFT_735672 [Mollisia scopiformis]|uniref:Uncharacterized protein n=1 Tax=Mollisia scopiformis TaxID=149040 RepID=A0A194X5W7_MOLSC|nr:uncharacterized protein LY89DRAFT_735672 [Mollisia scopiformis]KUJ15570.1 hypothetical protein LY89DRAFT_735672 [Mollisia scopiformis]